MRILTYGIGLIAAAALAVVVIGFLLPATRQGASERLLAAPPAQVAETLLDVASQPGWRSGIVSVEPTADGWTERTDQGEAIAFRLVRNQPDLIELSFESSRGYHGTWQGVLAPQEGGTLLQITETAVTPSPIGRILSRLFFDPRPMPAPIWMRSRPKWRAAERRPDGGETTDRLAQALLRCQGPACGDALQPLRRGARRRVDADLVARRTGELHRRIPRGETRTIDRLRNEMARKAGAQAMCPVTTAIYLKVVAEVALTDLAEGKALDAVIPFWRVVTPESKVAKKLSCGPDHVAHLVALERADGG